MKKHILANTQKEQFLRDGFLLVKGLIDSSDVEPYRQLFEDFLNGTYDTKDYRSDLGGHAKDDKTNNSIELITQIMVPSRICPQMLSMGLHDNALSIAQQLLGQDMQLDFDMLIDKAPFSGTPTPWHQDRAYWITMPDTRATSCWVALDKAVKDNGCMWYVAGSHLLPVREHFPAGKGGGALQCEASEMEGVALELEPGDCVFHHGGTLHYSRGNTTGLRRRAFITNFRPQAMIDFERENDYDHTGQRQVRDEKAKVPKP